MTRRQLFHSARPAASTAAPPIWYIEPNVAGEIMPVDPALLEILVCPKCLKPVTLVNDGAGLKCAECRRVYPIKDDIPIMLADEATVEP